MHARRIAPYLALTTVSIAVLASNPHSWVLIPVGAILALTAGFDLYRAARR